MKRATVIAIIMLVGGLILLINSLSRGKSFKTDRSSHEAQMAAARKDSIYFERLLNLHRIQFVLPDVTRVDIYKIEDPHLWDDFLAGGYPPIQPPSAEIRSLILYENPELLHSLRGCEHYSPEAPKPKQHTGFLLFCWAEHELDAAPHAYVYIPESGQIGRDHEWCYLPDKFQAWMKKLPRP